MLRETPAPDDDALPAPVSDDAATAGAQPVPPALSEPAWRCRELADAIGAAGFSLLFVAAHAEDRRLAPVFDSAFPGVSALSRALAGEASDRLAQKASGETAPLWWKGGDGAGPLCDDAHPWAREIQSPLSGSPLAGQPGLLLPAMKENGRTGVVAFYGAQISLDAGALCETHAAAFEIFLAVAGQRPLGGAKRPSMSKREIDCLRLTASGFTSEEIAAELGLSVHTANQYLTSSTHKLNAVNRIHAVAKALRGGLID